MKIFYSIHPEEFHTPVTVYNTNSSDDLSTEQTSCSHIR